MPFLKRPHKHIFWRTFFVLMLLDGAWAIYSVSSRAEDLKAEGNEFSDLVYLALPMRMAVDAVLLAFVAGVVVLVGAAAKR